MKMTLILQLLLSTSFVFGQGNENKDILIFSQSDFDRLRVYENTYDWGVLTSVFDSIPCFRDYGEDDIEINLIDPKTNNSIPLNDEKSKKYKLDIHVNSLTYDALRKSIAIEGYIVGGWYGAGSEVRIYLGEKIDTISYITLAPSLHYNISYNGQKLTKPIIIDTVSAFYMKNFRYSESEVGRDDHKKRKFFIKGMLRENTVLAFGLDDCYSEIFEIGKVILPPDTQKSKKN